MDQTLTAELDIWQVTLTTGDVVEIAAHGVAERGGFHVFVALVKGTPHYEVDVAAIPSTLVNDVLGGGALAGRLPYTGSPL